MFKRALELFGLGMALVLALAAVSLSGPESLAAQSCTVTVSPGESIQQVIESAPSGAVICLGEGTWEENLVIAGKSLTIRGAGAGKTVIRSAEKDQPVVWIEGDGIEVHLEGVAITGAYGECSDPPEHCAIGLVVKGSAHVSLRGSTVSDNGRYGLAVEDSARVSLQDSEVSSNEWCGLIVVDFAQVSLQGSTVSDNGVVGLWVDDSTQVTLQDSRISGNRGCGLIVVDFAQVSLQESQVSNNRTNGLFVAGSAQVSLKDSPVSDNGVGGLWVGESAQVSLKNSTVSGNGYIGLVVENSAQVSLQDSTVSSNRYAGLLVGDSAQVSIEGSLIEGNGTAAACKANLICICSGIELYGKARVELTNTTIRNNTGWGIAAHLKKCGYDEDNFTGTMLWEDRGNEIYGNAKGDVCLP